MATTPGGGATASSTTVERRTPASSPSGLSRWVPVLYWGRRYPRAQLRDDLVAGLTVAVMLIPQGMAYASLAGMPPITGLYAAIVGIAVYAVLGTSGSLAVGPVAITSLLTFSGLAAITEPGDSAYAGTAALLALMVGVVLVGLGIARLGGLVTLLSHPVISGFTSAAAIVIALSQVKDLLGVDIGRPHGVPDTIAALAGELGSVHRTTLLIGLASVVALVVGRRLARRFPTPLVVVGLTTLLVGLGRLDQEGVAVLGEVPSGLPTPMLPELSGSLIGSLAPVALTIAVVAYAEGVSVAKAIARKTREHIEPNQELVATGGANVAAGLFGGFPVAGGFSRTAVNHQSGARTPLASMVTAVVLAAAVLWMTPLFTYLPRTVLAAVVVVAVLGLVDVRDALDTWRARRIDGVTLAVTFFATLGIGIEAGLAIGVGFSLAAFVYRSATPHTTELGRVQGSLELRNVHRYTTRVASDVAVLRMDGPLFFAATKRLEDRVGQLLVERPELRSVLIDASAMTDVDASGAHALAELSSDLDAAGVALHLAVVRGPVRDVLERSGSWDLDGDRIHPSLSEAVHALDPSGALWNAEADEECTGHVL